MKFLKISLALIVGITVVAGACIVFYANLYITPAIVKNSIRFAAHKHLGRTVVFSSVEKKSLRTIVLRDIRIQAHQPGETGDIMACPEITIQFAVIPLLAKKLVIREIEFLQPTISLLSAPNRPFRLIGSAKQQPDTGRHLDLLPLPSHIAIDEGTLTVSTTGGNTVTLEDIAVLVDTISLLAPIDIIAEARFRESPESRLNCDGTVTIPWKEIIIDKTIKNIRCTGDISLAAIDLAKLAAYGSPQDAPLESGALSVSAHVATDFQETVKLDGTISLQGASYMLPATRKTSLEDIDTDLQFEAEYAIPKKTFTIQKLTGTCLTSPFTGTGSLRRLGNTFRLNGSLHAKQFSLDSLFNRLQQPPETLTSGLRLAGDIDLRTSVSGPISPSLFPTIVMGFKGNRILYPGLGTFEPKMRGSVRIDRNTITLADFKIGTPHLSVTLAGDLRGYRNWPPNSSIRIVSSTINFYDLFAATDTEPAKTLGPFNLGNLAFSGPINLGNIVFFQIPISNAHGNYRLADNKLHIEDFTGNIDDGGFSLGSSIDLGVEGLDYFLHLKLSEVPLKSVTKLMPASYAGFFEGTVSGSCALKGNGTDPERFIDNLRGDADLAVNGAGIRGMNMMPELSRFIKSSALGNIKFDKAQLHLQLRNGIMDVDGVLASKTLEMYPDGEVALDGSLDMTADLRIAQDIFSGDMNISRYLPREGRWISLPVTIEGTLQDPQVGLSEDTLNYLIKEALPNLLMDLLSTRKESGMEGLSDLLNREKTPEADTEEELEEEIEEDIEEDIEEPADEELVEE